MLAKKRTKAEEVRAITQKVTDWQIQTFKDMGKYRALPSKENRKPWHHRVPYHDLEWHCGALFAGMYHFSTIVDNPKCINWLKNIGNKNEWKLFKRVYHADDQTIGQFYLNLYEDYKDKNSASLVLNYLSKDMKEGSPRNLKTTVTCLNLGDIYQKPYIF